MADSSDNNCSTPAAPGSGSGWQGFPLTAGTDLQSYCLIIQLWQAIQERYFTQGAYRFPRLSDINYNTDEAGSITGVVNNGNGTLTITDSTANWVDGSGGCSGKRWNGYECEDSPWIYSSYDLIIEVGGPTDYRKVFRTQIQDNSLTTLTVDDVLLDYVTAGFLGSLSDIVGKKYYIIRRGGLWWADVGNPLLQRWPVMPNDFEYLKGTGTGVVGSTFTITTSIWPELQQGQWLSVPDNYYAGKDLLVYASDGYLYRERITASSGFTLTLTDNTSVGDLVTSGEFIIVAANGKGIPGRDAMYPYLWYHGATDLLNSWHPNDAFGTIPYPASNVVWEELDCETIPETCFCRDYDHPDDGVNFPNGALDLDLWSEIDLECPPADEPYAPHIAKTIRFIQNLTLALSGSFVNPISYDGFEGEDIPVLNPAKLLSLISVNSWTTTISSISGGTVTLGAGISPAPEAYGIPVYFAVYESDGDIMVSGLGSYTGATTMTGNGLNSTIHTGMQIVLSLGWSGYIAREHKYMFPKTVFVSDVCDGNAQYGANPCDYCGEGAPGPTCEKDCNGVGVWSSRAASTTYCEADDFGKVLSGVSLVAGEYSRYVGDTVFHPFDGREVHSGAADTTSSYYRFYQGQHPVATQAAMQLQTFGYVTNVGSQYITDSTKDWWNPQWYSLGNNHTDSGTATGGSTTTLIDTTKDPDPLDDTVGLGCFWSEDRFIGPEFANGIYTGFILEVNFDGVWHKRPIVSGNASTQTLTVSPAFPASTSGKEYRIREPKGELNRWKGRKLRLYPYRCGDVSSSSSGGGTALSSSSSGNNDGYLYHEVTITYSDDTTLWWDSSENVTADVCWYYEIIDPAYGTVWKYQTSAPAANTEYVKIGTNQYWVKPTGADAARTGVSSPQDFKDDQRMNLPTIKKRYRPLGMRKGDYIRYEGLNEIYAAINKLRHTKEGSGTWVDDTETVDEGGGEFSGGNTADGCANGCATWDDAADNAMDCSGPCDTCGPQCWPTGRSTTNGNPESFYGGNCLFVCSGGSWAVASGYFITASAHFDKLEITTPDILAREVDFYSYAEPPDATGIPATPGGSIWDDQGADVLEEAWSLWSTKSIAAGTDSVISDQLGNLTKPDIGSAPAPPGGVGGACSPNGSSYNSYSPRRGFEVTNREVIARWDVSGGLTFVD